MRRAFALNLLLLLAVNLLVKPIYLFGIEVGVQNTVGAANYGRYGQWLSFAFLFGIVYDLGLQNFNAVTVSKDPELLRARLPVLLTLKLLATGAFAALVVLAAWAYGVEDGDWKLVWLAVGYLSVLSLLQLLRTNVAAQGKYRLNSLISIIDKALLTLGLGAVLLQPHWRSGLTVELFFGAQIVALVITCGITLLSTDLKPGQSWLRWDLPAFSSLIRAAFPFGLVLLLTTALSHVDRVMIERISGDYETGKYLGAYRLLDGINMIGFMFATLLVPMLSKQVERGLSAKQLLQQAGGYIAALSVGLAAWTSFHGSGITELLYVEADESWGQTLSMLMWTALGVGFTYVYGSYLLARQQTRWMNVLFALALGGNVVLNWWLIPLYGAIGAAAATVLTQLVVGGGEYIRTSMLEDEWRIGERLYSLPLYAFGVLAVSYTCAQLEWTLLASLFTQVLSCAILGVLTGLLADPRLLLKLVSQRNPQEVVKTDTTAKP